MRSPFEPPLSPPFEVTCFSLPKFEMFMPSLFHAVLHGRPTPSLCTPCSPWLCTPWAP